MAMISGEPSVMVIGSRTTKPWRPSCSPGAPPQRGLAPAARDGPEALGGDTFRLRSVRGFPVAGIAGDHTIFIQPVQVALIAIIAHWLCSILPLKIINSYKTAHG